MTIKEDIDDVRRMVRQIKYRNFNGESLKEASTINYSVGITEELKIILNLVNVTDVEHYNKQKTI